MEKIIIKNFGPIDDLELLVKPFMIFIGPQASGKSTISKSIYFFKSIRNDVLKYLIEVIETGDFEKPLGKIAKRIREKFLSFFGPTAHTNDLYLHYNYGNKKAITINLKGRYINPTFNDEFRKQFYDILEYIKKTLQDSFIKGNDKFLSAIELLRIEQQKKSALDQLEKRINELFEDDKDFLFIPAGRSLLSTLSDQLQYIHPHKLDYPMQSFIDRINSTKPLFTKSMDELVQDKKYLTNDTIKYGYVNSAKKIIEKILKAKYVNDLDGEKLYVSNKKYVKINYSSSGQQESIWILNLIFLTLLNNNKIFIVFEEPEAHLYPVAQKDVIDLIAVLFNAINSQIIITTHSPYILSSINNLLYADILNKKGKNVESIVDKKSVLDYKKVEAYSVEGGYVSSIMDKESNLIMIEKIDIISNDLNEIFNKLFELED